MAFVSVSPSLGSMLLNTHIIPLNKQTKKPEQKQNQKPPTNRQNQQTNKN